jgi:hypothetical protein
MKTKVSNSEVARLWWAGTQEHASNGKGSFYFRGDAIYSYGSHFPIARKAKYKGNPVVLFTDKDWSITTAKHKGSVRHAMGYSPVIFVSDVTAEMPGTLIDLWKSRIQGIIDEALGCQYFGHGRYALKKLPLRVKEANAAMQQYGIKHQFELPANLAELEAKVTALYKEFRVNRIVKRVTHRIEQSAAYGN